MADKAHLLTDKKLEQMEKRLSAIYSEAQDDIQRKANEYFAKFEKADAEKRKLVKAGKMTEEEYKAWRQGKIMYGKRFTALKEDISEQLFNVNQTATAYINGELPEVYALNYNALADTVDGVGGYSFTLTDADTVRRLATTDTSLLPFRELDPAKDIPWNMKAINSEVLQGIVQGESIPDMSKRVFGEIMKTAKTDGLTDKEMGALLKRNKDAAVRSARTIVTGAENKGRMDSYQRAQDDGIILEKEWLAAIDKRTRDWHIDLNGVSLPIDKPFHNDFGDIMFPGDPSADGANVYNCRCTLVSRVKGFKKAQVEKAMAEKQVDEQSATQAKTKAEAETIANQFGVNADYSKYDISVANAMNETMQQYVDIFGKHAFDNLDEISAFAKGEKLHEWGGYSSKNKSIKIRGVNSKNAMEKFGEKMQKYQDGFFSTNSNLHIIRHEFAHAIHDVVEGNVFSELTKYRRSVSLQISKDVSFRAGWDDYEFVAECLAQYLNGHPSKIATEVVEIIKNGFKKKFG